LGTVVGNLKVLIEAQFKVVTIIYPQTLLKAQLMDTANVTVVWTEETGSIDDALD
jgi:hypothetical protein